MIGECKEHGWEINFYYVAVDCYLMPLFYYEGDVLARTRKKPRKLQQNSKKPWKIIIIYLVEERW